MPGPIVVLVVEDDALLRMNIVDALEIDGFTTYDAPNSRQALAALADNVEVDCLLTDVDLGQGMDGLALAAEVRRSHPDLGVIVVSGHARELPAGLTDAKFFMKPYSSTAIAAAVRAMVAR